MKITLKIICIIIFTFAAQAQELKLEILNGHSGGGVLAVAVSHDGKFALTGSSDQTALLWDLETGKQLRRFVGHEDAVTCVQVSKDGKRVLTTGRDKTARLWETATGKPTVLTENRNGIFAGHTGAILTCAISADGKFVATAGEDKTARIWDAVSGKQLHQINHAGRVNSIAFSPDSHLLLTGGEDKIARLFSSETGKEEKQFVGHTGEITSVAYSPDGKQILTGSDDNSFENENQGDNSARVWNSETAVEVRKFDLPNGVIIASFSPDGKSMLVINSPKSVGEGEDTTNINELEGIHIFEITSGKDIWKTKCQISTSVECRTPILAILSPDGLRLLYNSYSNDSIHIINVKKNEDIGELDINGKSSVVSAIDIFIDSNSLITGASDSGNSGLWNIKSGQFFNIQNTFSDVNFFDDGLFFAGTTSAFSDDYQGALVIFDTKNQQLIKTIESNSIDSSSSIAVSSNGRFIATGKGQVGYKEDGIIDLWEIVKSNIENTKNFELRKIKEFRIPNTNNQLPIWMSSIKFSPDNKYLASITAGDESKIVLWSLETNRVKFSVKLSFDNGESSFYSLDFSPDGKNIAATYNGKENGVRLFNVETGKEIESFGEEFKRLSDKTDLFKSVAYSPDGNFIAAGTFDGKVYLHNNETKTLRKFEGHTDAVNSVKFAKDARGNLLVVSGSSDSTTRIWNAATGEEICALVTFRDGNWAVVQTRTGRYDAPNGGEIDGIQWVFGNETIALNQLKDIYYTPNLLPRLLGYNTEPFADVRPLAEIKLFPEIAEQNFDKQTANLTLKLKNRGGGIGAVRVMVNGSLAAEDARSEKLKDDLKTNPKLAEATINFNIKSSAGFNPSGENRIEIITNDFDQKTQKSFVSSNPKTSAKGTAVFRLGGTDKIPERTFYAIVGGVSDYNGTQLDLNFAAKDAEDFANALNIAARRLFCPRENQQCDKVKIKLLTTNDQANLPTKPNFIKAFKEVAEQAKPEDVLVVYLSGHGTSLNIGDAETYFYLTMETENGSKESVAKNPERAISNTEILNWLSQENWRTDKKGIDAQNKVLILDTCAAGAFEKVLTKDLSADQIRALEKLKDRSGLQILMGSAANQAAYETSQYAQGLLTYALLEGMKGAGLKNEREVETGFLFDYAVNRVPKMDISGGTIGLQSPRIFGSTSIPIGLMTSKEDRDAIKILASPLPVFVRPSLIKKGDNDDTLELGIAFAKRLEDAANPLTRGTSGTQKTAPLVFVDQRNISGAYRVTASYTEENGVIIVDEIELKKDGKPFAKIEKFSAKDADELARILLEKVLEALKKSV